MFNIYDTQTEEWLDYFFADSAAEAEAKFLAHRPEFTPEDVIARAAA